MRILAAALLGCALLPCPAVPAAAQWKVETDSDSLDSAKKFTYASAPIDRPLIQFGRPVHAWLTVQCHDAMADDGQATKFRQLGAAFSFSESVAIGERFIRWRVDQHPVSQRKSRFYSDGKIFYVFTVIGKDALTAQLRHAKTMKAEFDLPWTGKEVREIDVSGGQAAFAKIPCK